MIERYQLPGSMLTALCAGAGSPEDIALLWSGQLSKRLLQLRAIIDATGFRALEAGRRAQLEDSYRSLAVVQRDQPRIVADLLRTPQVGAWVACCLRRLTSEDGDRSASAPLWIDLAHLGAITAAAALRCGVALRTGVPARAGSVTLPTFGRLTVGSQAGWELAHFELSAELATVRVGGEQTSVPRRWLADAPGWEPVRQLLAWPAGLLQVLALDDIDPYRGCFRLPVADRLRPEAVQRWRDHLTRAWEILAAGHPERFATVAASLTSLVPLAGGPDPTRLSASSRHAAGAAALTEPLNGLDMATTLVHESQHFKLNALHDLKPLYRANTNTRYYSPWRRDPRPLSGLLHGIYAFLGVAEFMHRETRRGGPRNATAELDFACCAARLRLACQQAVTATGLTPLGEKLVATMASAIEKFPDDVTSRHIRQHAEKLVAQHRADWLRSHEAT